MPDPHALKTLLASEPYWTALAMKTQGSRFFRALGEALDAADAPNRRRLYETWPDELLEFYRRGLRLEAAESGPGEG
ncbi:hypothetical protein [Deinococcus koreensis]|uniref:Uncharacterized protein n=1 Tax=Deinococcus koreensis TaxID=2054903 RepID=A0A2K3UU01_9DEIO|nr:hypothetical protein [Deinococcus koreensis]PNY80013.1 hypothetical protein CVO96_00375 [Deinococcus koreensis]